MNCLLTGSNGFLGRALESGLSKSTVIYTLSKNSGDYNVSRASDSNEQPLTAEGVEELFKEEETNESAPTNDEGEE